MEAVSPTATVALGRGQSTRSECSGQVRRCRVSPQATCLRMGTTEHSALPKPRPGVMAAQPHYCNTIQSNLRRRKRRTVCLQEVSQQVSRGSGIRTLHTVTSLFAVDKFMTSCHRINIYSQMTRCQAIQGGKNRLFTKWWKTGCPPAEE